MASSIQGSMCDLTASSQRYTVPTILTRATSLLTRALSLVALYVALGFAQLINCFFFAIIFFFILAPSYFWSIIFPKVHEEDTRLDRQDVVRDSMPRRRDTDDISVFNLDGNHRAGQPSEVNSNWLQYKNPRSGEESHSGSWLEGLEEDAVE